MGSEDTASPSPAGDPLGDRPSAGAALTQPISKRGFLKLFTMAGSGAVAGHLLSEAQTVQATYTAGTPADIVDTNLTVQGSLVVDQSLGVGTSSPQGKLDVAGEIRGIDGVMVVASDGKGKECYFVAGPDVVPPASSSTGSWGRVKTANWTSLTARSWNEVQYMDGSWDKLAVYSWNQLTSYSWQGVQSL